MTAFPDVEKIQYEGPDSKNPLAYRWYNSDEIIEGKSMKEHLRFSVVYWHTFRGTGADPFGPGCAERPWSLADGTVDDAVERARMRPPLAARFRPSLRSTPSGHRRSRVGHHMWCERPR